jgi:hypothetical protein
MALDVAITGLPGIDKVEVVWNAVNDGEKPVVDGVISSIDDLLLATGGEGSFTLEVWGWDEDYAAQILAAWGNDVLDIEFNEKFAAMVDAVEWSDDADGSQKFIAAYAWLNRKSIPQLREIILKASVGDFAEKLGYYQAFFIVWIEKNS